MCFTPFPQLSFLLVLMCIFPCSSQRDWQGTGNMSESNITEVQTSITNNPIDQSFTAAQIDEVAKTISTRLNSVWSPAWGVVIVRGSEPYDSVLYSYAFRDHWMWIDGVPIPSSPFILSYLVWKDYNCNRWVTAGSLLASPTTFNEAQISQIRRFQFSGISTDPWTVAFNFIREISARGELYNGAYNIVLSQESSAAYSGYFCIVNSNYLLSRPLEIIKENNFIGSYLLFQTR